MRHCEELGMRRRCYEQGAAVNAERGIERMGLQ